MEGMCVYACVSQYMLVVLAVVGTQTHAGCHRTAQLTKSFGSKHPAVDLSFSCVLIAHESLISGIIDTTIYEPLQHHLHIHCHIIATELQAHTCLSS